MADIGLRGLTKVFRDGTVAVDGVDLAVPDGSLFVLVGPSGSGKTTVLRLVAGLERPTEGTILIGGEDVTDSSPRDRDVAMIFQSYALYPHLTAFENIAFGLRSRRVDREEVDRRVRRVATLLGLDPVLQRRPKRMSGGQRQRVALGRAIVREPQVFLMDEPLSDLDTNMRNQMRGELARLQQELGVTTLYVTHDQGEALTLGDLIAVMDEGVVRQVGTREDIYDRPADLFVATFLGSPPMNLAEGTIVRGPTGPGLRLGSHTVDLDPARADGLEEGRQVVAGIRPEHLRPARSSDDHGRTIHVTVDDREELGTVALVRFTVDAPLLTERDPRQAIVVDQDAWAAERRNTFVARVESEHPIGRGGSLDLFVDEARLHLFDPATELAIR